MIRMGKRKVLSEAELKELVLPAEGEILGRVIKMLGSDHVLVKCVDNKNRIARIRGKLKRKIWVRDNDVVLVAPWEFKSDERGDVVWRYTLAQVDWLKTNGYLPQDF
jgi:translation initiation factor 1A